MGGTSTSGSGISTGPHSVSVSIANTASHSHAHSSSHSVSAAAAPAAPSVLSKIAAVCAPQLYVFILLETISVLTIASAKGADGRPVYNSAGVVLIAELFKLGISVYGAWEDDPWLASFFGGIKWRNFAMYSLPAFLYAVNNNIYLKVLTVIHPSIFQLFMNLRVVWTGILFRFTLGRTVTPKQWAAMLLLFTGCALTVYFPARTPTPSGSSAGILPPAGAESPVDTDGSWWTTLTTLVVVFAGLFLTLAYTVISTAASVIGEVLLKSTDSLHVANIQLYFFGVVFNLIGIFLQGSGSQGGGYLRGWEQPITWAIVFLLVTVGLITSRIMKNYDSIVKIFCVSMGNFVVYAYSVLFQGQPLALSFIVAFALVSGSAYTYQLEKMRLDAEAAPVQPSKIVLSRPEESDIMLGDLPSSSSSINSSSNVAGGSSSLSGRVSVNNSGASSRSGGARCPYAADADSFADADIDGYGDGDAEQGGQSQGDPLAGSGPRSDDSGSARKSTNSRLSSSNSLRGGANGGVRRCRNGPTCSGGDGCSALEVQALARGVASVLTASTPTNNSRDGHGHGHGGGLTSPTEEDLTTDVDALFAAHDD